MSGCAKQRDVFVMFLLGGKDQKMQTAIIINWEQEQKISTSSLWPRYYAGFPLVYLKSDFLESSVIRSFIGKCPDQVVETVGSCL